VVVPNVPGLSDHSSFAGIRIEQSDHGGVHLAGVHGDPAGCVEQVLLVGNPGQHRAQRAQQRIHTIQAENPLLGVLTIGDVHVHAETPSDASIGVEMRVAAHHHPAHLAIRSANSEFRLHVQQSARAHDARIIGMQPGPIFGKDKTIEMLASSAKLVGSDSEQGAGLIRPGKKVVEVH
jgi:hypothetical protein